MTNTYVSVARHAFVDHDFIGSTETDERGYYEITGVPNGEFNVVFSKKGYIPIDKAPILLKGDPQVRKVDVSLPLNSCEISGRIVDAQTLAGLGGVTVRTEKRHYRLPGDLPDSSASTNSDGFYVIKNVGFGTYRLIFGKIGYETGVSKNLAIGYNGENRSVVANGSLTQENIKNKKW